MKVLESGSATLDQANPNLFVPMSESQMTETKGGFDFTLLNEEFQDALEGLVEEYGGWIDYLNEFMPIQGVGEGDWDDIVSQLEEDGWVVPDWDDLEFLFDNNDVAW